MVSKTTIALAAGMVLVMTGGMARGTIILTGVTYNGSAVSFPTVNPSVSTIAGPNFNGSLSLTAYQSLNNYYINGTMNLQANLNYSPVPHPGEDRGVSSTVLITFTTDETVTWTVKGSAPGEHGQAAYGYMSGGTSWGTGFDGGGTVGPGTYTFHGVTGVGGVPDASVNGYSTLWFQIPAPSAALTLLGAGFIASARRRR